MSGCAGLRDLLHEPHGGQLLQRAPLAAALQGQTRSQHGRTGGQRLG